MSELASGKLVLDRPAEAVARLTLSQSREAQPARPRGARRDRDGTAGAGRGNRDPLRGDHRLRPGLLGRVRHRGDRPAAFRARGRGARRPPLSCGDGSGQRASLSGPGGDQRALLRRRAGAGGALRPADLRRRRQARDAAGEARPDLRPHRARAVHRRGRRRLDQGAVPDRPRDRAPSRPARSGSSTRSSPTPSWRRRRWRWRARSPPTPRSRSPATSARSRLWPASRGSPPSRSAS